MPTGIYERQRRPVVDRFWEKVARVGDCWLWTGARDPNGYGRFHVGSGNGPAVLAHRQAWELLIGPIPDGLCVLHHCDNPPCTCPFHLFLGTRAANVADMRAKGRYKAVESERVNTAKLTAPQVREIRTRYRSGGVSFAQLGREYGIAAPNVSKLVQGITWRKII